MQKDNKIKIAVSSCLLGEAVRYDGTDKHIDYITGQLSKEYTLISLCPEMAIGMGVPRAPIHLVDNGKRIDAVGVEDSENNVTDALLQYGKSIQQSHPDICGYIFKKNSPSCGPAKVKVMVPETGIYEPRGQGVYVSAIRKYFPGLPVIDEEDLLDVRIMNEFINKVAKFSKLKNFVAWNYDYKNKNH
ncbi:MAG: DUF523 domain-containing protein [Gammaproteobacteria bacterium]|nr:DUF523 domain-containing protein [Gammaproteobacteria bacterium]